LKRGTNANRNFLSRRCRVVRPEMVGILITRSSGALPGRYGIPPARSDAGRLAAWVRYIRDLRRRFCLVPGDPRLELSQGPVVTIAGGRGGDRRRNHDASPSGGVTAFVLVFFIAVWALATGILRIVEAVNFGEASGRGWLAVGGAASII